MRDFIKGLFMIPVYIIVTPIIIVGAIQYVGSGWTNAPVLDWVNDEIERIYNL